MEKTTEEKKRNSGYRLKLERQLKIQNNNERKN